MTTLSEFQFEILPTAEAADGFVFGIGGEVSVDGEGFDPGENNWLTQDQANSRRGVAAFGRDVLGSKSWTWASHTDRDSVAQAVDTLDRFSAAWHPEDLVSEPGALTALRYRIAGRDRRVFGRPRRYAAPPTNLILSGFVPVTHDFALVDGHTYDDELSQVAVPYSTSAEGGGMTFPVTFPITTAPSEGTGSGQVDVGGTARTYPVLRFYGPWTNPGIVTDDWSLSWTGSIAADNSLIIDLRPWALTALKGDGSSAAAGLDPRTWLEDCWFAPNTRPQIRLTGTAPGGGAYCTVSWRNAWTSI